MGIHQVELNWIHHLHRVSRCSSLDAFFIYWDYVDTVWFSIIFAAIIAYLFNRNKGSSLFFLLMSSSLISMLLKNHFHLPRPCQVDPLVGIVCYKSFGFPSGAAQTGTIILGMAFMKRQSNICKMFAVLFALFLYFSRVYLGLHFFTDILGGVVVGAVLVWVYLKFASFIERHLDKCAFGFSALLFFIGGANMFPQAGMTLGLSLGLMLTKETELSTYWSRRIFTLFSVLLGTFFLLYLGEIYPSIKPLMALLAGFWFTYLGSSLVEKMGFKKLFGLGS